MGAPGLPAAAGTSLQAVFCVVLARLGKKEDTSVLMFDAWGGGRRAMLESEVQILILSLTSWGWKYS